MHTSHELPARTYLQASFASQEIFVPIQVEKLLKRLSERRAARLINPDRICSNNNRLVCHVLVSVYWVGRGSFDGNNALTTCQSRAPCLAADDA